MRSTTASSPTNSTSLLSKLVSLAGIILVGLCLLASILGIIIHTSLSFVQSGYTTLSSHYVHVWLCIVLGVYSIYVLLWFLIPQQALSKISSMDSASKKLALADIICFMVFEIGLACLVAFCSSVIFIAYLITPFDKAAAGWVWTWVIPSAVLLIAQVVRIAGMIGVGAATKPISEEEDLKVVEPVKVMWIFVVLRIIRNILFGIPLIIICISLMVQACISSTDAIRYQQPGKLVDIEVEGVKSQLHVYCAGTRSSPTEPVWLFEHGGGAFSGSFIAVQDILVKNGKRVCIYDRAGYGWSPSGPLPRTAGRSMVEIHQAMMNLQENPPFNLVGHSVGGQNVLIFASLYPETVAGLAILDSYPEYTLMLAPVMNYTQEFLVQDYNRVLVTVNALRFLAPLGWLRWIAGDDPAYKPAEKRPLLLAMYGSNRAWNSQYHDFYLSHTFGTSAYVNGTVVNGILHPYELVKPETPVLVMPAGKTVKSDCKDEDAGCRDLKISQAQYMRQAEAFVNISNNGTMVIVEGEGHGYPWQTPELLAKELLNKFG